MGKERKVFAVFILVVLLYGLSYYFSNNWRFAFSPEYSGYALGIISLAFFFYKRVTKYSYLLVAIGMSCFYPIANLKGFTLISPEDFILVKNGALILSSVFILYDLNKGKFKSMKWFLLPLSLMILLFFVVRIIGLEWSFQPKFSFVKNCLCFGLVLLILRQQNIKQELPTMLLRLLVVIGLSFFIEWMDFLTH